MAGTAKKPKKNTLKSPDGYISQPDAAMLLGGAYSAVRKMIHEGKIKDHGYWEGRHLVSEKEVLEIKKTFKPRIKTGQVTELPNGDYVVPIQMKGFDYRLLASAAALKDMSPVEFITRLVQADAKSLKENMSAFVSDPFGTKRRKTNPMDKVSKR